MAPPVVPPITALISSKSKARSGVEGQSGEGESLDFQLGFFNPERKTLLNDVMLRPKRQTNAAGDSGTNK